MKRNSVYISIPKPCHESWDRMDATERGAFCHSCQKEVIDFSTMTDREVIEFLARHKTGCGRFRKDQVETTLTLAQVDNGIYKWRVLLLSALTFLGAKALDATPLSEKYNSDQSEVFKNQKKDTITVLPQCLDTSLAFSGKITDEKGEGLIGASICILDSAGKTTGIGAVTDLDGNYLLSIPKTELGKYITIRINYIGYTSEIIKDIPATENRVVNAQLYTNTMNMTVGELVFKPLTPSQKLNHWFRKIFRIKLHKSV